MNLNDTGMEALGKAAERSKMKVFWLVDTSSSMAGTKITILNQAVRECVKEMQDAAEENQVDIRANVISFGSQVQWIDRDVEIRDFKWNDLKAKGYTPTGSALSKAAEELTDEKMGKRNKPPLMILMSDGGATDDYEAKLRLLLEQRWAKRAVRIPIAIGSDCDIEALAKFSSLPDEPRVLQANNPKELIALIQWASITLTKGLTKATTGTDVLPPPPMPGQVQLGSADDSETF
jgi:uncharacterized protein YegL